jgi:hypothetical protein
LGAVVAVVPALDFVFEALPEEHAARTKATTTHHAKSRLPVTRRPT